MTEIDPLTGLPKELDVFENISKESQHIVVRIEKRRYGKPYTTIDGVKGKGIDIKDVAKTLKMKFACGGTIKNGVIELQGDYTSGIKKELVKLGFDDTNIDVEHA